MWLEIRLDDGVNLFFFLIMSVLGSHQLRDQLLPKQMIFIYLAIDRQVDKCLDCEIPY